MIYVGEKTMKDFFSSNTLAFENDLNYHYFSVLVFTFLLLNLGANMKILKLNIFFTSMWDFTWRVSDCEELVGVTHRR